MPKKYIMNINFEFFFSHSNQNTKSFKMYTKSIALIIQTCLVVKIMMPPNSNLTKKFLSRKGLEGSFVSEIFPNMFNILVIIQVLFYFYVMYQQEIGLVPILPNENHKFSEWNSLEILCFLCNTGGCLLRSWCFNTLKEYFTFNVTIQKDHKLITTGPYSLLIHPSVSVYLYSIFCFSNKNY